MFGKTSKRYFKSFAPLLIKGGTLLSALILFGVSVTAQPDSLTSPHVNLIVIDGGINPAVDDFIRESIEPMPRAGGGQEEGSDMVLDRTIVFTAVGTLSAFMLVIGYLVVKSQRRKPTLGMAGLMGEVGEVRVKLNPSGKIFIRGEYWNTDGDGEIDVGEKVRVVGFEGMCLKVKRLFEGQQGS